MWNEIAAWQEKLAHRPDLSAKTIALYTQDARSAAVGVPLPSESAAHELISGDQRRGE